MSLQLVSAAEAVKTHVWQCRPIWTLVSRETSFVRNANSGRLECLLTNAPAHERSCNTGSHPLVTLHQMSQASSHSPNQPPFNPSHSYTHNIAPSPSSPPKMPKQTRTTRQAHRPLSHIFRPAITPLAQRKVIPFIEISNSVFVQDLAGAALGDGVGEGAESRVGAVVDARLQRQMVGWR